MTAYISYPDKPYIEDEEDTMNNRMGDFLEDGRRRGDRRRPWG